jgi:hypothetical protein
MSTVRILTRRSDTFEISSPEWAGVLALALRYEWNPPGPSTSYLAMGFHVSDQNARLLSEAFDRIFDHAQSDPMSFYPIQIDMGTLSLLNDFIQDGEFDIGGF